MPLKSLSECSSCGPLSCFESRRLGAWFLTYTDQPNVQPMWGRYKAAAPLPQGSVTAGRSQKGPLCSLRYHCQRHVPACGRKVALKSWQNTVLSLTQLLWYYWSKLCFQMLVAMKATKAPPPTCKMNAINWDVDCRFIFTDTSCTVAIKSLDTLDLVHLSLF